MGGAKGGVKPIGKRWPTRYDNDVIAFLMFVRAPLVLLFLDLLIRRYKH